MAKKFYAVKRGVRPGVYETWSACEPLVKGFPGAIYKGFPTRQEAEAFVGGECVTEESKHTDENMVYAFVDGSYNSATQVYGYGGFLMDHGERYVLQGHGDDPEMASMRNVAGEILGAMAAVKLAVEKGLTVRELEKRSRQKKKESENWRFIMIILESRCGQPEVGSGTRLERLHIMTICSRCGTSSVSHL